jgi:hypothetical protein
MITKIRSSQDALDALNENLEGMLTGKRKLDLGKSVETNVRNNLSVIKMELMEKIRIGDKTPMEWFTKGSTQKQLKAS